MPRKSPRPQMVRPPMARPQIVRPPMARPQIVRPPMARPQMRTPDAIDGTASRLEQPRELVAADPEQPCRRRLVALAALEDRAGVASLGLGELEVVGQANAVVAAIVAAVGARRIAPVRRHRGAARPRRRLDR